MAVGMESVVVGVAVAGAGAWAVRALVRSLKKPGGCSSCASSGACPLVKGMGAERTRAECSTEGDGCSETPRNG